MSKTGPGDSKVKQSMGKQQAASILIHGRVELSPSSLWDRVSWYDRRGFEWKSSGFPLPTDA